MRTHATATRVYLALALMIVAAVGVLAAIGGSVADRRSADGRAGSTHTVLLGSTVVAHRHLHRRAGAVEAFPFRAVRAGSLRRVHVYLGSRTRAHELRVGLFAGRRGRPGTRLRVARLHHPRAGRWNAVRVHAISLVPRRTYWVALLGTGGRLALRAHAHRSCTGEIARHRHARIPSKWRLGRHSHLCPVSLYGTGRATRRTRTAPTPTTPTPTTTTAPSPPTPTPSVPVPCSLTHAAGADGTNSCWATHTGVQGATGYTEAQIEAGAAPGFTKVGNVTVTTPGTTIDHEWIDGCVAVDANGVTIEDSLVTPPDGDYCEGGNEGTTPSAINDGDGTTPTGLVIKSTTVDGGNSTGNQFGVSIDQASCILCNVSGFAKNYATGGGTAAQPAVFIGDYSHDLSVNSCSPYPGGCTPAGSASDDCAHDSGFYMNSSDYVEIEGSYSILTGAGDCTTGAITNLGDGGPPNNMSIIGDYMEGVEGADLFTGKTGNCGSPNIVIENNAFSNDNGFGGTDLLDDWTTAGNTWSGNYIAETGRAVPEPATQPGC